MDAAPRIVQDYFGRPAEDASAVPASPLPPHASIRGMRASEGLSRGEMRAMARLAEREETLRRRLEALEEERAALRRRREHVLGLLRSEADEAHRRMEVERLPELQRLLALEGDAGEREEAVLLRRMVLAKQGVAAVRAAADDVASGGSADLERNAFDDPERLEAADARLARLAAELARARARTAAGRDRLRAAMAAAAAFRRNRPARLRRAAEEAYTALEAASRVAGAGGACPLPAQEAVVARLLLDEREREGAAVAHFVESLQLEGAAAAAERVPAFLARLIDGFCAEHAVPVRCASAASLLVQRAVYPRLWPAVFAREEGDMAAREGQLARQLSWIRLLSEAELGVPERYRSPPGARGPPFGAAVAALEAVMGMTVPRDMLRALVAAAAAVYVEARANAAARADSRRYAAIGADEFLPLFVYVVAHARLARVYRYLDLMKNFSLAGELAGEPEYYLASFEGALACLHDMDPDSLTPPPSGQ